MIEVVLSIRGLRMTRGDRTILGGIDLEVSRGELVALHGLSGSGKTTALRAVAGLEPFDGGTITVGDATFRAGVTPDPASLKQLRRQVGMVFQFHCLWDHMSALRNVCLAPVHAHGIKPADAERRARQLFAQLGVDHRADALPRELSGGEAQRVAIARALAVDPPLLLMDEPMASLDPSRREELAAILKQLTAQGHALLMTSHDPEFAAKHATRTIVLEGGVIR